MTRHPKHSHAASWLAAVLMLAATEASATQTAKHDAESAAKAADEGPRGAAGQKAAVDQAGRLRPVTPEEARALVEGVARLVDQSGDGLAERFHESGAVSLDLDDRFQSVSMARVAVDGSVTNRCVTTVAETERFLGVGDKTPVKVMAKRPGEATATGKPPAKPSVKAKAKAKLTVTAAPLEEK